MKILSQIVFILLLSFSIFQLFKPVSPKQKPVLLQTVKLHSINDLNKKDFDMFKETLEKCFFVKCEFINTATKVSSCEIINCEELNNTLYGNKTFLYDSNDPIDIHFTKTRLSSLGSPVCGVSYGNQIYIRIKDKNQAKSTLVHEIAHSFGLSHCDEKCVMNINYTLWDCKNDLPIFCDECKANLLCRF